MKKFISLLRDKCGISNTVEMLGVTILLSILTIAGIVVAGYIHNITVLDRFADEMVSKVAFEGKCSGAEITERYEELVKSTGIRPTISYDAKYYSHSDKTVQYGNSITVTVQMEINVIGFGDFIITDEPIRKSTGQSMQYWKG